MSDVVLVGYGPEDRGRGGIELGRLMAATGGFPMVVVCVVPDRWRSGGKALGFDRDYHTFLVSQAEAALKHARESLEGSPVPVSFEVVTARSAPAGLMQAIDDFGARLIVCGSSSAGAWGHVALGSVTHRMVRGSRVPVALAPRGLHYTGVERVDRVTLAFDGTAASKRVLRQAAQVAAKYGNRLRVVTFAVRTPQMYPTDVGLHTEERVHREWREQAADTLHRAVANLDAELSEPPEVKVCEGSSWRDALEDADWNSSDVLVIGSSASEPRWSRVFLGSTAARILRHSPVPTVVVP